MEPVKEAIIRRWEAKEPVTEERLREAAAFLSAEKHDHDFWCSQERVNKRFLEIFNSLPIVA